MSLRPQTSTPLLNEHHSIHAYKPKFYITKAQRETNEQLLKGKVRDPPNSREFRKTIPNNMVQDRERLYEELNKVKQLSNSLSLENYQLRVQVKSLENVIQKQLTTSFHEESKFDTGDPYRNSCLVAIPKETRKLRSEVPQCSVIAQFKQQIMDLKDEIQANHEEMLKMKRSAKLTRIQEIEAELQRYSEETLRLKRLLHLQLLKTEKPSKEQQLLEERYLQQQEAASKLSQQNRELALALKRANDEVSKLNAQLVELESNFQKSIKEKTQLKKDLQDLEEQFNKAQLNDPLFRRGQDVTQIKLEYEKKVVENNSLKNEGLIKDRKIHDLEKNLKETTHTFQEKLNSVTKEKETFKEKYEKQKIELMELQDKYQQLFFNSNRNLSYSVKKEVLYSVPSMNDINQARSSQDSIVIDQKPKVSFQDSGPLLQSEQLSHLGSGQIPSLTPPGFKRKLQRQLSAIKQDDVEEIITQTRYKLRSQNIRMGELEIYLFSHNENRSSTTLGDLIQIFQKKPFDMNQNESVMVARFLIEPQDGKVIQYNPQLSKSNEEILATFTRALGKYNILVGEDKTLMHESIRFMLNSKRDEMMNILKPKPQKGVQVTMPDNLCTRASFKSALELAQLDEEQLDVLMQTIYEKTHDFNFIDLEVVWQTWPKSGPLHLGEVRSRNDDETLVPPQVAEVMNAMLVYAEEKNLSIMNLRSMMDLDHSGHIERAELRAFLKKCQIEVDETEFGIIVDYFDIEGDGRISVNDIGTRLKAAQQNRINAMREQRSARKTGKQVLALVAQHFVDYMQAHNQDLFQIFMSIDQDGQGTISKDEFKQMLRTKIIIPLDQDEYQEFFKLVDHSNDGQIHFNEFQLHMIPEIERITGKPYHEHLNQQLRSDE